MSNTEDENVIPTIDLDAMRAKIKPPLDYTKIHHAPEFRKELEKWRGSTTFKCLKCGSAFNRAFREIGIYQYGKDTSYMLVTECPSCKAHLVASIRDIEDLI